MNAVVLGEGVATVGAGARLGDVYDALEPHGVTIAAGCGPTVGIAGLVLGGGLGILGRRHGLTSDQLTTAQVVLADGRVVDCDEHRHGDLFWALRGAGGCQFGVVTTLTLRTVPAPATTTLHLQWEQRDAVAVIEAWQGWAPDAPDELAASLLLTAGGDPGRPPVVHVFGAMQGGEAAATELLEELVARAVAEPTSASLRQLPYRDAKRRLSQTTVPARSRPGAHGFAKSEFFRRPLPNDVHRRARRAPRRRPSRGTGARARLLALGRRVQPRPRGRHCLRAPRRAVPDQARRRDRPRRDGGATRARPSLARALVGDRPSLRLRARVSELPRPRARRLARPPTTRRTTPASPASRPRYDPDNVFSGDQSLAAAGR